MKAVVDHRVAAAVLGTDWSIIDDMTAAGSLETCGFTLDPDERLVRPPDGGEIRLEPKVFELLTYLIEHRGRVVGREEILDHVWGGRFVSDDVVTVSIYAIRQAFGETARDGRFVRTVPRKGYRWVAPLGGSLPTDGPPSASPRPGLRWAMLAAGCVLAVASLALVGLQGHASRTEPRTVSDAREVLRSQARAVFFGDRRTRPDLERAIAEYQSALVVDDRFAEIHAALAETCVVLSELAGDPDGELQRIGRGAAERALELDADLAIGWVARAAIEFAWDHRIDDAEASFRHALEIDPSIPSVRRRYAFLLAATGRFDQARQQARAGVELAPTAGSAWSDLGWIELVAGHLDTAEAAFERSLELDPRNLDALLSLGFCRDLDGRSADAFAAYREAMTVLGFAADSISQMERAFETGGLPAMYRSWKARLGDTPRPGVTHLVLAFFAARGGDDATALSHLQLSVGDGEAGSPWIAVHPAFASLRGRPELERLAREAGISQD